MWLTVRTGKARGKSARVEGDRFVVGRDEECELVIPDDPKVSRKHASVEPLGDGQAALRDLGSSNGTFVNGERVASATLHGNEQIQLGETVLVSSATKPDEKSGSTVLGSAVFGAAQRLVLQRAVRRATLLGVAALVAAATVSVLFATNVLPVGSGQSDAIQRVVRAAARSTVLVEAQAGGRRVETGSGWVLDGDERLVVTNAHVVNGGRTFLVGVGNDIYQASIVGVAPCDDLAVLKLEGAPRLDPLPVGQQSSIEQGEVVVALGYPANASQEARQTSTTGVVSVVRTTYREPALDVPRYENVIQTDAAINPGNSGGPLLDLSGKVIGVNSAGRTVSSDGRIVQGQSYAIGADRVKAVTDVLRGGRSIGWTGLGFDYPSAEELAASNLPAGLVITRAAPGSGPRKASLARERPMLVAVDGTPVGNSLASYCDAVRGVRSGQAVSLSVVARGAKASRTVTITME